MKKKENKKKKNVYCSLFLQLLTSQNKNEQIM